MLLSFVHFMVFLTNCLQTCASSNMVNSPGFPKLKGPMWSPKLKVPMWRRLPHPRGPGRAFKSIGDPGGPRGALPATADGGYDDIVPLDPSSIPDVTVPACRYGSLPTPQDPCLQFSTPLSNVHYSTVHSTAPIGQYRFISIGTWLESNARQLLAAR